MSSAVEVTNTPINHSVIFIKETEAAFTNDFWRVVIHFKIKPYEEVIEVLKTDLVQIMAQTHQTTLQEEARNIQTAVDSLEVKLRNLRSYLPLPDRRRGLMNIGGAVLKLLLGTAMDSDVKNLHSTMEEMGRRQGDIIHAVNQQLTFLKQLDSTVTWDHDAIANWSYILKDFAQKTQEKFQKTVSRLEWNEKQSEVTTAVRQLEFTLMQLELQVDELLGALQVLLLGKIPVNLITFAHLYDVLKNVTLRLPEGYELVFGAQPGSTPWYVKYVKAAMLADLHSFYVIMYFPLTSFDRTYQLYKAVTFPTYLMNGTYVSYVLDAEYVATNMHRQAWFTLSERELKLCDGDNMKVCPANKAINYAGTDSCVLALFLQHDNAKQVCRRSISSQPPSPRLERRDSSVVYHFPEPRNVNLRCRDGENWVTTNIALEGAGILSNVNQCHISAGNLQLYAEIRGETDFEGTTPRVVFPPQLALTTDSELQQLKDLFQTQNVEELVTAISNHKLDMKVDTLTKIYPRAAPVTNQMQWTIPVLIATSATLVLVILYYCTHTYVQGLLGCNCCGRQPESRARLSADPAEATVPAYPQSQEGSEAQHRESSRQREFSTYAVHQAAPHA